MSSLNQPAPNVKPFDALTPLFTALDLAERALFGTPASPVITLCEARECGTHGAACLVVAEAEDRGVWLEPAQCRVCGGWFVVEEPRHTGAAYVLRAYPGAVYARWSDLTDGYAPIAAPWCVLTLPDGYAVHRVLDNGTLGALIERVRL